MGKTADSDAVSVCGIRFATKRGTTWRTSSASSEPQLLLWSVVG